MQILGNPKDFSRRKYGGWGVVPSNKSGWLHLAIIILPFAIFQSLPFFNTQVRSAITGLWFTYLAVDIIYIMSKLEKDEREMKHEALAERNATWFMLAAALAGMFYQAATSSSQVKLEIDPFLAIILFGGALAKSLTNWWLRDK